ncbi:uncharacterized protein PgNI_12194 [Pyricularia grisea]|uniref:Heterokaryon incompatibility domain-containing protein n=1 Tax=Pyricularia grisea TaxID=148305 RepID=A0A6P8AQC8_PYRGI|nr:uncharacterized protein PgNI_12194 [Pyricularia grisea]TLD04258.1 hypothetical protein PgNI_12194 [Pyricularia grisea]
MENYQYRPLSAARQIRIFRLFAGGEANELSGELVHASFDKLPVFLALSYAWGNSEMMKTIRCSNLSFRVKINLYSALRHLRQPDSDTLLWADALCINQEDIPERNQQVRMMGDIYAAAERTIIWLGPESKEINLAFDWLQSFAAALGELLNHLPTAGMQSAAKNMEGLIADQLQTIFAKVKASSTINQKDAYQCISVLLQRSWFTRKWIIQELFQSRKPMLAAGRNFLDWTTLALWLEFIQLQPTQGGMLICNFPESQDSDTKVPSLQLARATLLGRIQRSPKRLLMYNLATTLDFECGEPRDHIFALVGIASDANRFNIIDYGSTVEDICRQLANVCVSDATSLRLLWLIGYLMPLERRLHSWVPNLETVVADRRNGSNLTSPFWAEKPTDYSAAGDSVLQASVDAARGLLRIRGRIVDKIQLLGQDCRSLRNADFAAFAKVPESRRSFENDCKKVLERRYRWMEQCIAIAKTTSSANGEETFSNALWGSPRISEESLQGVESAGHRLSAHLRLLEDIKSNESSTSSSAFTKMESYPDYDLEDKIAEGQRRRFGSTVNRRTGWLPPMAKEGDLICIFDGMDLPYAICSGADGRYLLIGECVITGLMNGEGMKLPNIESEIIVLE